MIAIIGFVLVVVWICAIVHWDGKRHCDRDCKTCPFPPCDEAEREK